MFWVFLTLLVNNLLAIVDLSKLLCNNFWRKITFFELKEQDRKGKVAGSKFMTRIKVKWGIDSNLQIAVIFVVFALTGFSVVYFREWLFTFIGINHEPWYIKTFAWIILVFPSYQILLLFYGTIFGQFRFFWSKEKKMLLSIARLFKKSSR
jgi:hypothetical protein